MKKAQKIIEIKKRNIDIWAFARNVLIDNGFIKHSDGKKIFRMKIYVDGVEATTYAMTDGTTCLIRTFLTQEAKQALDEKGITRCDSLTPEHTYLSGFGVLKEGCLLVNIYRIAAYTNTFDIQQVKKSDEYITLEKDIKEKVDQEVGVELELESELESQGSGLRRALSGIVQKKNLSVIQDVGIDGSVRGGVEIRFSHFPLGKWKFNEIKHVVSTAETIGLRAGPSAGMHVHISHPKAAYAASLIYRDIKEVNEFLKPVCCREWRAGDDTGSFRYGLNNDILRNQWREFKTVEIRCWSSTTNPLLIYKRMKFTKMFIHFIIKNRGMKDIWKRMSSEMRKLYTELLYLDNQHGVGMPLEEVLQKLGA